MTGIITKIKRAIVAFGESGQRVMSRDLLGLDGSGSAAGVAVSPEKALGLPAVLCAISMVAETLGMLPLLVYERQGEAKQRARKHPLYRSLRQQPNRL